MPCVFLLLVLLFPRVVLAVLYFFTRYLNLPFHNQPLTLIVGFLFFPITTLYYAWLVHAHAPVEGTYLIIMIVVVILDLGSLFGGASRRR